MSAPLRTGTLNGRIYTRRRFSQPYRELGLQEDRRARASVLPLRNQRQLPRSATMRLVHVS